MSDIPQYTSEQKITGMAIAIPILISLFIMVFPAGFAFIIITAISGKNVGLGGVAAGIVYLAGLVLIPVFMIRHYKNTKVSFFDDHLEVGLRREATPYSEIGDAHLTGGGKYIVLQRALKGQLPQRPISFSPKENAEVVFEKIVSLIKRGKNDAFFTVRRGETVQYFGKFDKRLFEKGKGQKLTVKRGRPAYRENHVFIGEEETPRYAILQPYDRKKHNYYRQKVLVSGPIPEHDRCEGEGILTITGYLSKAEVLPVGWQYYEILTSQGSFLGKFQVRKKYISPIDDFKLTIFNRELAIHGDILDHKYKIMISGSEIGSVEIPLLDLHTHSKIATIVLQRPLDPVYSLALALALDALPRRRQSSETKRSYGRAARGGVEAAKVLGGLAKKIRR